MGERAWGPQALQITLLLQAGCCRLTLCPTCPCDGFCRDLTHRAVTKFLLPSATDLLSDIANGNATSNTAGQQVQLPASTANGPDAARHQQQNVSILPNTGLQLPPEPPRVRIFAHVEGNFATVVYIAGEVNSPAWICTVTAVSLAICAGTAVHRMVRQTSSVVCMHESQVHVSMQRLCLLTGWLRVVLCCRLNVCS